MDRPMSGVFNDVDLAAHRSELKSREVERLAVARGDLPALDQHLVERAAEAVDVDALHQTGRRRGARGARIVQAAAIHRDARQPRDRLADVAVRELADILRRHRVDDADGDSS